MKKRRFVSTLINAMKHGAIIIFLCGILLWVLSLTAPHALNSDEIFGLKPGLVFYSNAYEEGNVVVFTQEYYDDVNVKYMNNQPQQPIYTNFRQELHVGKITAIHGESTVSMEVKLKDSINAILPPMEQSLIQKENILGRIVWNVDPLQFYGAFILLVVGGYAVTRSAIRQSTKRK